MDVTAHELRTVELREAWRGYRQDDVDTLLERVAGTIERLQSQVERLSDRLAGAESEAGMGREADEMLRRTLLLAQRTADAAVAEAQERARRVLSESEAHAHSIVSGAEEEARRIAIAERHRVESEIRDLTTRRELLLADVEALEQAARDHRRRLREFLETEIARVDARPVPQPPEAGDVGDIGGIGDAGEVAAVPGDVALDVAIDLAVEEHVGAQPVAVDEPVPDELVDQPGDATSDAVLDAAVLDAAVVDAETGGGDFGETDILPNRRRRWRREPEPEPEPPDDAFFDELRRAVTDETPLGPRDDEPVVHGSFFDQDEGSPRA